MFIIREDIEGPYIVRWAQTPADVLANTRAFIAHESQLDASQQLKDIPLALLQAKYAEAVTAQETANSGEVDRAQFSASYRACLTRLRANFRRILAYLQYKHADNLMRLETYGLNVRHAARGGYTVALPRTDADLIRLLETYLAHESSLSPADRIPDPTLPEMQTLFTDIQRYALTARQARVQRSDNILDRHTVTAELHELLRCAAYILLITRFGGKVTPALGNWGFTVVRRSSNRVRSTAEDSEPGDAG